jgi:hypothetical protein
MELIRSYLSDRFMYGRWTNKTGTGVLAQEGGLQIDQIAILDFWLLEIDFRQLQLVRHYKNEFTLFLSRSPVFRRVPFWVRCFLISGG